MGNYKNQILRLRKEGKTYIEIREELGCAMSLISYYSIPNERAKALKRFAKAREDGSVMKSRRSSKTRNRNIVDEYLQSHPCVDCGNTDIRVLEFDHVRGVKIGSIAHSVHRVWPVERLLLEIEKCEIRCCNCHRIATIERRNTSKLIN